jgi:hypothetical protein
MSVLQHRTGSGAQQHPFRPGLWRSNEGAAMAGQGENGGRGWIRTTVGVSQRVYSASPLAARAPVRRARYIGGTAADSSMLWPPGAG